MSRTTSALLFVFLLAVAARAEDRLVTVGGDDENDPVEGSIRHIMEQVAKPGDTIRFASNVVIPLQGTLDVRAELTGLRIVGPVQLTRAGKGAPRLDVHAAGAVVDDVSLRDVSLRVRGADDGTPVAGVELRNCKLTGTGLLSLAFVESCVVEDCTVSIDSGRRDAAAGIQASFSADCRLSRNRVELLGKLSTKRGVDAIRLTEFTGVVEGNTAPVGSMTVMSTSATVRSNVLDDGGIVVGVDVLHQDGPFEVSGNRCASLSLRAVSATVAGNIITLAPGTKPKDRARNGLEIVYPLAKPTYSGAIAITGNQVQGGRFSTLGCSTGASTTQVTISDNTLEMLPTAGLYISASGPATVLRNVVTGANEKGANIGVQVRSSGPGGGVRVEGNTVTGVRVAGIEVRPRARATLVGNTVTGSAGYGIVVSGQAVVTSTRDTVEDSGREGFFWVERSSGSVLDGTVVRSGAAGLFVDKGALVEVRRTSFTGNAGPGIDIFPRGVTADRRKLKGNLGLGWPQELEFDEAEHGVKGKAGPGAVIEVFRVEDGARAGNPANGEGAVFLSQGIAEQDGTFTVPVSCNDGDLLTVTATEGATTRVTSEFSEDVECKGAAIELLSVSSAGTPGNDRSELGTHAARAMSADGRFVVFTSSATNLVAGDTNERPDVFLRDRTAGTTVRVSLRADGSQIVKQSDLVITDGTSGAGSVSDDGRYVAFTAYANRVIPTDTSDLENHVYLHDVVAGTTAAVSGPVDHAAGSDPSISGDGRFVAFVSVDPDWDAQDHNGTSDVFVWDRTSGAVSLVSRTTGGGPSTETFNAAAQSPRLSSDGRFVVFCTAHTLTPGDTVSGVKVFVRDRQAGTTELVSRTAGGVPATGASPSISADGRYVAFTSFQPLVAEDTNGTGDVYVRDRTEGTLVLASRDPAGELFLGPSGATSLSGDGRFVAFVAPGGYDSDGFTLLFNDVYVRDLVEGITVEAAVGPAGDADDSGAAPCLDGAGRAVVFASRGSNLVPGDAPFAPDVFLRTLR